MILNKEAIIEALLFTWGDPLNIKDIASILELNKKETQKIIDGLINKYKDDSKGLQIIKIKDNYQLTTKPDLYDWVNKLNKPIKEKTLSNASMETLSIIAYKQPVIKSEIEKIRGVRSDGAIRTLIKNDLIQELGRMETIGKPIIYGTTDKFLQLFGLEDLNKLPELEEALLYEDEAKLEADEQLSLVINPEDD